jgi:hypothetical protein
MSQVKISIETIEYLNSEKYECDLVLHNTSNDPVFIDRITMHIDDTSKLISVSKFHIKYLNKNTVQLYPIGEFWLSKNKIVSLTMSGNGKIPTNIECTKTIVNKHYPFGSNTKYIRTTPIKRFNR